MIDYIHAVAYIGVVSTLIYIIPLCYWDIKYRKVPKWVFTPLILINIPSLIILYTNGLPFAYIAISGMLTAFFIYLFSKNCYRGADARFLILISWFCILNPINPLDSSNIFQLMFVIFLSATAVFWMIYVYFYNRKNHPTIKSLWQKFSNYPRGSPWMIPIAAAFILAVVFA